MSKGKIPRSVVSAGLAGLVALGAAGGCTAQGERNAAKLILWGVSAGAFKGTNPGQEMFAGAAARGIHDEDVAREGRTEVSQNVYVDGNTRTSEGIMKPIFENRIDVPAFVCNTVDPNRDNLVSPREFPGIEKHYFDISEPITIGLLSWQGKGSTFSLRLITPSLKVYNFSARSPGEGTFYSWWELGSRKEVGTNTLIGYRDGRYATKFQFEITP